ncbi:MAG: hypothetical protein HYZ65_05300 [Burkholderiales bacterium]|nr:hypothetical protein [Burkholderiales bacterium]
MKPTRLSALLLLTITLSACSSFPFLTKKKEALMDAAPAAGARAQSVDFVAGRSSTTVEKLAQKNHCTGGKGAGLLTERGPLEIYRMSCSEGGVFMARCELRQCQAMPVSSN